MGIYEDAIASAARIEELSGGLKPAVGIVLGSGWGMYAKGLTDAVEIPYGKIPHFPESTAPGHEGKLYIGKRSGCAVAILSGRFHCYEGYSPAQTVYPVRVLRRLGIENLIVTNAAGGINLGYKPGDLMLIEDHINFAGRNPLDGRNDPRLGVRFPDMSYAYSPALRALALRCAAEVDVELRRGVYVMAGGPSYETPAEIRMFRALGADAVGMSTVPEVIAANHCGLSVMGISCITNMAAGVLDQPLTEEEVLETAAAACERFTRLLDRILEELA